MQDTTQFINEATQKCYLATMEVSSLYTNIDTDEGLTIVQEQIGKTNQNKPSSKTLSCLLDEVHKVSNFTFHNEQYIQIKGTDVGLRVILVAPNFANVYMKDLVKDSCTKQCGQTM